MCLPSGNGPDVSSVSQQNYHMYSKVLLFTPLNIKSVHL